MPAKKLSAASPSTAATPSAKGYRRNILNLWLLAHEQPAPPVSQQIVASQELLDRYMIALHRLQTEGRDFMNFAAGIHNGGWYTPACTELGAGTTQKAGTGGAAKAGCDLDGLMYANAVSDSAQALNTGDRPHGDNTADMWPNQQANVYRTPVVPGDYQPILPSATDAELAAQPNWWRAHQFCWHARSPFFIWHRPFMMLFERLLQYYDPNTDAASKAANPIGVHYFMWEDWDGCTLPDAFNDAAYTLLSDTYTGTLAGGNTFPNPLKQWANPRAFIEQYRGVWPHEGRSSTRDPSYVDRNKPFDARWRILDETAGDVDSSGGGGGYVPRRSVKHITSDAMSEPHWCMVASVEWAPSSAMEETHNRFHNRIGGNNGTMASNQSPFDPIFYPHHSNIERQLASWQNVFLSRPGEAQNKDPSKDRDISKIPEKLNFRMYPFAPPATVYAKLATASTPIAIIKAFIGDGSKEGTGLVADWFADWVPSADSFDVLCERSVPTGAVGDSGAKIGMPRDLTITVPAFNLPPGAREYTLRYSPSKSTLPDDALNTSTTYIAGGGNCPACANYTATGKPLKFDASLFAPLQALMAQRSVKSGPVTLDVSGDGGHFEVLLGGNPIALSADGTITSVTRVEGVYTRSECACGHFIAEDGGDAAEKKKPATALKGIMGAAATATAPKRGREVGPIAPANVHGFAKGVLESLTALDADLADLVTAKLGVAAPAAPKPSVLLSSASASASSAATAADRSVLFVKTIVDSPHCPWHEAPFVSLEEFYRRFPAFIGDADLRARLARLPPSATIVFVDEKFVGRQPSRRTK